MTLYTGNERFKILHMMDVGIRYGQCATSTTLPANTTRDMLETIWLYRPGAPSPLSADLEFCKRFLDNFLSSHSFFLEDIPGKSSNKHWVVERNSSIQTYSRKSKKLECYHNTTYIARPYVLYDQPFSRITSAPCLPTWTSICFVHIWHTIMHGPSRFNRGSYWNDGS